jgi:uncharacterized membrane protein YbhN (UPF0104 family)
VALRVSWPICWRFGKLLLAVIILVSVGWQFAHILRTSEGWHAGLQLRPLWSISAGLVYLLGLGCSAFFWYCLLRVLGQRPSAWRTLRAFYVGQLGRYVPGKVVGIVVRAQLLSGPGVRRAMAVLTIIYEALTALTAGALLAMVLVPMRQPERAGLRWQTLGWVAVVGIFLLPAVFNRLVRRVSAKWAETEAVSLPRVRSSTLGAGLVVTGCGWGLQGVSLLILLQALCPQTLSWSWETWSKCTGFLALATLVGFLVVVVPSGLGVRELLLQRLLAADLTPMLGAEQALSLSVVVVLLLRLIWTTAEVTAAGLLYWMPVHDKIDRCSTCSYHHR